MTLEELEISWATLQVPVSHDAISGKRAAGMPLEQPVYLAVDGRGRRHLLILVPDDTVQLSQHGTRALEVCTARFQVGSNAEALYVDLACIDPEQNPTFSAVAQDMLMTLASSHTLRLDAIISALARWRAFWSTRLDGMSKEDALGLFGELWFMRRWLRPVDAKIVECWQATESARHDFQSPAISVEVKTSASRSHGEPLHPISSLDQMDDPEQGQFFLFSLHLSEDALAENSLHSLVEGLGNELRNDFQALASLNDKLAARSYNPSDQTTPARRFRILSERLYRIGEGFPRIIRRTFQPSGLPPGVTDVEYTLDMAACQPWLVAIAPTETEATQLHSAL